MAMGWIKCWWWTFFMYNTSRDWELDWLVRDEERNNGLDLIRMVWILVPSLLLLSSVVAQSAFERVA